MKRKNQFEVSPRYKTAVAVVSLIILIIVVLGYLTRFDALGMWEYTYDVNGIINGVKGFKTFWDWMELLIFPLALAIGAISITQHVENSQKRNELVLKIANDYYERYDDISKFHGLTVDMEKSMTEKAKTKVQEIGNWLEMVSTLCNKSYTNQGLIKELGIDGVLCRFYNHAKKMTFLEPAIKSWDQMETFYDNNNKENKENTNG